MKKVTAAKANQDFSHNLKSNDGGHYRRYGAI
jgi:hypothetical protein